LIIIFRVRLGFLPIVSLVSGITLMAGVIFRDLEL